MTMSESNVPTPTAITPDQRVVGPINAALAAQLEGLLAQRSPSTITSGFLAWFGDTQFPDGSTNAPPLTQQAWERYYYRLQTAALSSSLLPPLSAIQMLTTAFRPDGPLPIAIACFQCAVPKPDFKRQVIDA